MREVGREEEAATLPSSYSTHCSNSLFKMSGRFFRGADSDSDSDSSSSEEEIMSSDEEGSQKGTTTSKPAKTAKQSRFLKDDNSDDSDSDSDDDDDDEDDSDDDSDDDNKGKTAAKPGMSRFMRGADESDSDEDEVKKVIKSAKDKRFEEVEGIIKNIENAQRIGDWVAISKGELRGWRKEDGRKQE